MSRAQAAVHLHVHSEYSLLDGACKLSPRKKDKESGKPEGRMSLAERAAELGMPALGLTDHGVMNGAVEHYKACRANGIKPILGMEAYLVEDRDKIAATPRYERNHLTLIATSDTGFGNLVKLSSAGFLEGFSRGKANLDLELISRHSEGVIALTGCLQSRFCRRLVEDRPGDARAHIDELMQVFGPEQVYFELQRNGLTEQEKANEGIVKVANEVGRPLVATADVHYLKREDYDKHAALLCVQTKSTVAEPKLRFDNNEFFLKSPEEMANDFSEHPGAVETTLEIADRCEVELELGKLLLPRYPTPDGEEPKQMLRRLATEGLSRRYGEPPPAEALERLEYELGVIEEMGFESYFLIVWDFVRYAKQEGIAVGPGRGSAAGSIVAFTLAITDVDPLEHKLLFERFLNPARKSMPDIDIDFSVRGREQVIGYVQEKYGRESVAQIITFGKMAPRAATRDAARVLGYDYGVGDRLAKQIPEPIMGRNPRFKDCLVPGEELQKTYESDPDARKILDVAQGLEGIVRNNSIHAAAVVIADRPLQEIVPLQLAEDRATGGENGERSYKIVTQYSMGPIEEIGLLKMDFLGLRNLDVIEDAVAIIDRSGGEPVDMEAIPLDDQKTYEMLARGDSVGVFQLESDGMREALRKVKPTEFEDIVALVSLYRPGAMRYIPDYAKGKRDPSSVRFPDERLKSITQETYGCVIYQEQLMEIAKQMAGFSGAEADDLRKAVGKKKREQMAELRPKFEAGLKESGTEQRVIKDLWSLMTAAADYSFNRSHAACYGLIAYRTALAEGQLPGRVHGGADLIGDADQGQGAVLRQPLRGDGNRGAPARRQRLRPWLRRLRQQDPLRARRGQERRLRRGADDPHRPRRRRRVRLAVGLLRANRRSHRQQAGRRVPGQVRRARLDRRHPQGDARGASDGRRRGPEGAGGRARRPGLDLRARRLGERGRRPHRPAPSTRRSRSPSSTRASCCGSRRRRWARSFRRIRSTRSATPCAPRSTARSPTYRAARTARWSPSAASSPSRRRSPPKRARR